jgi:YVTN family beta-propeller protein
LEALGVVHDVTDQPSCSYKITTSTVFKLQAYGYRPEPDTSTTTVFAYKQDAESELEFTGVAMQNWPVVLATRVHNSVFALDAGAEKIYRFDASDGERRETYDGSAMALNSEETELFICIERSVVMVSVRWIGWWAHTILSGAARAMVSNGSDTLLCCAMTDGSKVARIQIGSVVRGLGRPTYIPVGDYPISMVFNDDSSMLYVANYGSNSISLIRLSDNSVTNINLTASKPNSMVYQKALKRLFVACEGEDKVAMIELSNNTVTYIKTGAIPSRLLFNPNQDILYVTNFLDNTVSVIDAVKGEAKLPPLTVGEGPLGMALNEDCNLLFVCNYCSRTLSVIELPGNHVLPEQLPTGRNSGNPFGLAFREGNDYAKVFVGKENFPGRPCTRPSPNTSLSVAAYSIQKPRMPGDL